MRFNVSYLKLCLICLFNLIVQNFLYSQYCTSSSASASFCSTSLVEISSLSNASVGCANYSDYTSIYTELILNGSYNLTIGLDNCSGFTMPKISNVYIDWNGNDIFDVEEEVFHINATSAVAADQTNFSTTITVPANAVLDTIRMRVVTSWSTFDDPSDYSCGIYGWGETEDYSLVINSLIENVNSVNNLCFGANNGEISISTVNTSGLAYSIDGGLSFSASPNFNNLANGLYNICVFDSLTNQSQYYSSNPVIIDSPDSLFAIVNKQNISCFNGADGGLSVEAYSGTPNYDYNWTNGSINYNGNNIQNLSSGNYNLIVLDNNDCLFTIENILLENPEEIIIDSVASSAYNGYGVSCYNSSDGFIEIYASGGTGNLSYNWAGNVSNSSTLQNVQSGDIPISIFDNNFCQLDTIILISEPEEIIVETTILHLGCENENNGSISTDVTGGATPYNIMVYNNLINYDAINSNGQEFFGNLEANSYNLVVTDLNNCIYEDSFKIENPTLNLTSEDISCYGNNDGQIIYSIDFSTDIYNLLSPVSINGLASGTYDFLLQNDQGCFFDSTITINEPNPINLNKDVEIICKYNDIARINIEASGGTSPYYINWDFGDTTFNTMLGIGIYNFIFSDANGCILNDYVEVLAPNIPELSYTVTAPSCEYNFDGSIDIQVTKGYPPYAYKWNDGRNGAFIDSLPPKRYRLNVIDSAGCASSLLEVTVPYVYNKCFYFPLAFTPNNDGINDIYEISSIFNLGPTTLTIYNNQGTIIYQANDTLSWDGKYKNRNCAQGKYYFHLKFANQYTTGEILLIE